MAPIPNKWKVHTLPKSHVLLLSLNVVLLPYIRKGTLAGHQIQEIKKDVRVEIA
jgi:hypothetical protein